MRLARKFRIGLSLLALAASPVCGQQAADLHRHRIDGLSESDLQGLLDLETTHETGRTLRVTGNIFQRQNSETTDDLLQDDAIMMMGIVTGDGSLPPPPSSLDTRSPSSNTATSSPTPVPPTLSPVMIYPPPSVAPADPTPTSSTTTAPSVSNGSSCPDGQTRDQAFLELLSTYTSQETLLDTNTPQGMAFVWILSGDPSQIDPCASDTTHPEQRYALAVLYYSTGGSSSGASTWINQTAWLTEANECTWYGITCDDAGLGKVTRIELGTSTSRVLVTMMFGVA